MCTTGVAWKNYCIADTVRLGCVLLVLPGRLTLLAETVGRSFFTTGTAWQTDSISKKCQTVLFTTGAAWKTVCFSRNFQTVLLTTGAAWKTDWNSKTIQTG